MADPRVATLCRVRALAVAAMVNAGQRSASSPVVVTAAKLHASPRPCQEASLGAASAAGLAGLDWRQRRARGAAMPLPRLDGTEAVEPPAAATAVGAADPLAGLSSRALEQFSALSKDLQVVVLRCCASIGRRATSQRSAFDVRMKSK